MRSTFALFLFALLPACSSSEAPSPAAAADSELVDISTPIDEGVDTAMPEVGDTAVADVVDASPPFDIIGTASGACDGSVAAAVKATGSVVVEIPLSFDTMDKWERA